MRTETCMYYTWFIALHEKGVGIIPPQDIWTKSASFKFVVVGMLHGGGWTHISSCMKLRAQSFSISLHEGYYQTIHPLQSKEASVWDNGGHADVESCEFSCGFLQERQNRLIGIMRMKHACHCYSRWYFLPAGPLLVLLNYSGDCFLQSTCLQDHPSPDEPALCSAWLDPMLTASSPSLKTNIILSPNAKPISIAVLEKSLCPLKNDEHWLEKNRSVPPKNEDLR